MDLIFPPLTVLDDSPVAPLDPMLGSAEASAVHAQLRAGRTEALFELLAPCRDAAWDARSFYLDLLVEHTPLEALEAWVRAHPDHALGHLTLGARQVDWAWEARGTGFPHEVSPEAQRLTAQRLERAEASLMRAIQLDPADPSPYPQLMVVGRATGRGEGFARDCFEQALRRDARHWQAHYGYFMSLTRKWGGSHEAMFDFARQIARNAPVGDDLGALPIVAWYERWLAMERLEGDKEGARRMLKSPEVLAEATQAYERSIGSSRNAPRWTTVWIRNWAAVWFYLTEDKPRLDRELRRLGTAVDGSLWNQGTLEEQARAVADVRFSVW